jgi:hypothetical protein
MGMSNNHKPGGVKPPMDLSLLVADATRRPEPVVIGTDENLQVERPKTERLLLPEAVATDVGTTPTQTTPHRGVGKQPKSVPNSKLVSKVPKDAVPYPWETADSRIISGYNVRLREPLHEKMRWIVANSPGKRSIQTLVVDAIEAECARILAEMGIDVKG